jgi:hypothetical protein
MSSARSHPLQPRGGLGLLLKVRYRSSQTGSSKTICLSYRYVNIWAEADAFYGAPFGSKPARYRDTKR